MAVQRFTGRETSREHIEKLNALVEAVERWDKLSVGPGLEVRKHAGGMLLNVKPQAAARKAGAAEEENTDVKVITSTHGVRDTDTLSASDDEDYASLTIPFDIQYDASTVTLSYRTRTIKVRALEVSGESELITIAIAEMCY